MRFIVHRFAQAVAAGESVPPPGAVDRLAVEFTADRREQGVVVSDPNDEKNPARAAAASGARPEEAAESTASPASPTSAASSDRTAANTQTPGGQGSAEHTADPGQRAA